MKIEVAVTSCYAERTQLFKVRTGCGHIVERRMRPATAGFASPEDAVLLAPGGAPCDACASR